jgi:glycosyltransferase involved in cell wall biosynthesis
VTALGDDRFTMKTIFATADLPWQAPSGGRLRDLAIYRALRSHSELTLVCFPLWTMPQPDTPLEGARVFPAPLARDAMRRVRLRLSATVRGRMVFQEHLASRGAFAQLAEVIAEIQPETVILGHPLYDGFLPLVRPHVRHLVVDLWELRGGGARERMHTAVGWSRRVRAALDLAVLDRMEREVADYADEVWLVEERDAQRYASRYSVPVRVVPNTIDVAAYARYREMPREAESIAFVGIFDYDPNLTAAVRLLDRILPALRARRPGVRLVLAGRRPPPWLVARAGATPGATLLADVPDAVEVLARNGPLVAPMESGTGTRLKLLEAAAAGVPIVTTAHALRGLTLEPGKEVCVAQTDDALVESVVALWESPSRAASLASAALARVEREFDMKVVDRIVDEALRPRS